MRRDTSPPSIEELERLEGIAAPLYAALPPAQRALVATPPARSRQNRATSISWRLRAEPGTAGTVRIADATGAFDSAMVATDSLGLAAGAFRALPTTAGWQEWSLSWEGVIAKTGAWILPERALGVLVVSGPASVEARDVARALESTGARVTLAQSLGRGLTLGDSPAGLPSVAAALESYDVVLVLGDVALTPVQVSTLASFAAEGGGVLAAGAAATALPIARRAADSATRLPGSAIEWLTPAEVAPLPAAELEASAVPLAPTGAATFVAARTHDSAVLVISPFGRGRMAALALENTWIWGLQAGRGAELAAFWRGLADWLDGGARAPFAASVDPAIGAPGAMVLLEVGRLDSAANAPPRTTSTRPGSVTLTRSDATSDLLPLAWQGAVGYARFVPSEPGTFVVGDSAGDVVSSSPHHATLARTPPPDAWARLALLAAATGGEAVPTDALEERLDALGQPSALWPPKPLFWLAIVLALAVAEWVARRLRGLA